MIFRLGDYVAPWQIFRAQQCIERSEALILSCRAMTLSKWRCGEA